MIRGHSEFVEISPCISRSRVLASAPMSAKPKKNAQKGKRYTDAEKQVIVNYVNDFNAKNGRGGQAAAVKKFGVTALSITAWMKATAPAKPAKPAAAPKAAKAPAKAAKAAKPAKQVPAKVEKVVKVVKVAKVAKKAAKKGGKKAPQGTRYTDDQKQAVLAYVAEVNAKKGRGGMSAAAKKFKITPLTVSTWITKFGGKATRPAAVERTDDKAMAKLLTKLAKAEAIIASIKAKLKG